MANDQVDMGAVLGKLAAADPDGVFFPLFPVEAISLSRQAAALGALEDVTMTGSAATPTRRRAGPVPTTRAFVSNPLLSLDPRTLRCLAHKDKLRARLFNRAALSGGLRQCQSSSSGSGMAANSG